MIPGKNPRKNPAKVNNIRFVLDSTVVINHLNKKLDIDAFFDTIPDCERFVSIVTEIETLSDPEMAEKEEKEAREFLAHFDSVVDIIPAIKEEAIKIRRAFRIKLPDAVIAATAIILDATLLSNDPHHTKKILWPGYRAQSIEQMADNREQ